MRSYRCSPIAMLSLCACLLIPAAATAAVRFAVIGDRTGSHVAGVYESIVNEVDALTPDFVVTVGDHIEGYTEDVPTLESQWDEYDTIVRNLHEPLFVTPGNHDILNATMESEWRKRSGHEPNYTFDREGIHFVVLDTGRWETSEEWLAAEGHRAWLEADLTAHANAPMTIVLYHKPYWYATLAEGKPDPMHEIFREHGVDAVFNGHFHLYGTAVYDGIQYTIVGSSGGYIDENVERGAFFGYLLCSVREGKLGWAVLRRGSVRAADATAVADLKFFDHVDADYVKLDPFAVPEDGEAQPVSAQIKLQNAAAASFRADMVWDDLPNWSIEPRSTSLEVSPGGTVTSAYRATAHGSFYPLPRLRFDYPYRQGRTFRYETVLPALRVQPAKRCAAAPTIDGALQDPAWGTAGTADTFCGPDGGACPIEPTTFLFSYDDANLYLAARCSQVDMKSLSVKATDRDGSVSRDDCVGYFLSCDPAEKTLYQIYVSASGVVFDQKLTETAPGEYDGDGPKWNGDFRVATRRGDSSWDVEVAVPWTTLGGTPPKAGERWRVNFRRKEIAKGSSADWQFPVDYAPNRFGYLSFE
jgi:hypothetical protein